MRVAGCDGLILDRNEHFQKMTWRNRYRITGANNAILLTVPLLHGRNQAASMNSVQIFNEEKWQVQHWRTLMSVYRRSPFFEHYAVSLSALFENEFTQLVDFNYAAMLWVMKQLKLTVPVSFAPDYQKIYPDGYADLRAGCPVEFELPKYYQIFEDRIGFIPDLSILDLLFSAGPDSRRFLSLQH